MRYFKTKYGYVSTIGTVEGIEIRKEDFDKAMSDAEERLLTYQPEPTPEERLAELEAQNQMLTQCLMAMSQIVYA